MSNSKPIYDLEDRTLNFAKQVRNFTKQLPRTVENIEDIKQLVRASGSQGANYIEANESLSKKDFLMRVKISRKEAKESVFFLQLVNVNDIKDLEIEREKLIKEGMEITKILGSIIVKTEKKI